MIIKTAELEAVAVRQSQYPPDDLPEIAFAGRSNVGKSSLLNLLVSRKNLARVSGSPGKTRTINFYRINGRFRIVDLPGYGYARVSRSVTESWGAMMENYLENRRNLLKVILLVDIRHDPTAQDVQMFDYIRYFGYNGIIVATKADKISRNQAGRQLGRIRTVLSLEERDRILPVSGLKRTGREELLDAMEGLLPPQEQEE